MGRPVPRSVLSLDVGERRIGLAGCDSLGITITQIEAIHRTGFLAELQKIKHICIARNVKGLIIGLPLSDLGKQTKQSKHCQKYGLKISKELELPLAWVNEHSTSWVAAQKYKLQNDRSGRLDSAAAGLLLDQWLKEGPELEFLSCKSSHP